LFAGIKTTGVLGKHAVTLTQLPQSTLSIQARCSERSGV
jgi:hypothetical protein